MSVGRYQVDELLGRGSMGMVYTAFDPELERPVALKLLHPQPSKPARMRMEREARALARLSHPNVVRVYDTGVYRDRVFIAMELVDGQSLKDWCRSQPAPGWRAVLRAYLQAARGIAAAHARGLIHRDIKPANILIDSDGRARVADFGLVAARQCSTNSTQNPGAVAEDEQASSGPIAENGVAGATANGGQIDLDRLTATGAVVGTPAFMSPEQHYGGELGPAADQYSFCVALHDNLYNKLPFRLRRRPSGLSPLAALYTEKMGGLTKSAPARGDIPVRLYQVIQRGLAPRPGDRYPSMDALIAALESVLRRPGRISRVAALGAVAGLAICLTALAGLYWRDGASSGPDCRDRRAALADIWNPAQKDRVQAAFLGTGLGYAQDTFNRVAAVLDGYADAWVAMRTETCEATRVGATQSEAVQDLRLYCLDRRRQKFAALTAQYAAGPDRDLLPKAVAAAQALPPISYCADVAALHTAVQPPRDPAMRARVEQFYPQVYQLEVLYEAGQYRQGLVRGEALLAEMAALDYPPLRARAMLEVARLQQETGDYSGAEARLRAAIEIATRAADDLLLADAWTRLVENVGVLQDRYQEALDLRAPMNAAVERVDDDLMRAQALNSTGLVLAEMGAYEDARGFYERASVLWEQVLGPNHPTVAAGLANLSGVLRDMGQYEQAVAVQDRARSISENAFGPEHPKVATALNTLALVFEEQGKYQQVEEMYTRALHIYEKALGPDNPIVAKIVNNLGVVLVKLGRYDEAEAHHQRALRIQTQTLGPEHADVAGMLNNLAVVLMKTGRYEEAHGHYKRAVSIQTSIFGPEHAEVATSLNNLAVVLEIMNRYEEARLYGERVLRIRLKTLGPEHIDVASSRHNLGTVLNKMGKYEEAKEHYEHALRIKIKTLGPENVNIAVSLNNLALVLANLGRYQEAKDLHLQALAIQEQTKGPEHPEVAGSYNNLAMVLFNMGEYEQARTHLERAVAISETALGPAHPWVAIFLSRLGRTLVHTEDLAAAERTLARADEILNQAQTPRPSSIVMVLLGRGELALARGRPAQAVALIERALRFEQIPLHRRVAIQFVLARALWTAGEHKARALAVAEEARSTYQQMGNQIMQDKVRRWLAAHSLAPASE